jgi:protein-disulfide isomerase
MRAQRLFSFVALAALAVGAAPRLHAQESDADLRREIEQLKQGQQQIQKQLQELKQLVQARPAAARPAGPNVEGKIFDLGDNPMRGATSAKLTLVEFTDYQ